MKRAARIFIWMLGILGGLALLVVGSIGVDTLRGPGRVAALTNTAIPNDDGPTIRAYVARPSTPGPHPAVIMVHEWWGLRSEIVGKADALASEGYVVVAPDVLRGRSTSWIPSAIYQVSTTDATQIDADLDSVFRWLTSQTDVQADRVAIMGFCFGGGTALRYSLGNDQLAATAMFYGTTIADPQRLRSLPGPLLGIFGGADSSIPVAEVQRFDAALDAAGVPNTVSVYEGQPHAFVRSIDEIRQGGPQAAAWNELLAFLQQSLDDTASWEPGPPGSLASQTASTFAMARAIHL